MASKDEARRELARRELARRTAQPDRGGVLNKIDAGVRGAADMMSFGFADEIAAGLGTGFGQLGDYDKELARQRGIDRADEDQNTYSRMTGQLAGAVIPALATGGGSVAPTMGARVTRNAALGAAAGGAYGFGSGEGGVGERAENAKMGAALGAAGGAGGQMVAEGIGKVAGALAARRAPAAALQTADDLQAAARSAYQRADDAGVAYTPDALKRIADTLKTEYGDFGFHPQLQPRAGAVLGEVQRLADDAMPVTLKGLETTRRIAGNAYDPTNKPSNALVGKARDAIDDLVTSPKPGDVLMGDAAAGSAAMKEARDLYGRSARMGAITEALTKATNRANSTGSGGNVDNAIRQEIRKILENPRRSRGFSDVERAAMQELVDGTPTQNALRLAGKLSPGGNGLMAALGLGGTMAAPQVAVPTMIASALAKGGADRMTQGKVRVLEALIANGGQPSKQMANLLEYNRIVNAARLPTRAAAIGAATMDE